MKTSPAFLVPALLFAAGCVGPGSGSSSAPYGSVVSGQNLRERVASSASGSSRMVYLGSDSVHHHFRDSSRIGDNDYVVPRAEINIRNPYAYEPLRLRQREVDFHEFTADNPYVIQRDGAVSGLQGPTPSRADEYGRPKPWPAFGITGGEPLPQPIFPAPNTPPNFGIPERPEQGTVKISPDQR